MLSIYISALCFFELLHLHMETENIFVSSIHFRVTEIRFIRIIVNKIFNVSIGVFHVKKSNCIELLDAFSLRRLQWNKRQAIDAFSIVNAKFHKGIHNSLGVN